MSKKRTGFLSYYNTFFEKIYRYIFFRVGRDRELAEDLTSEIMLKAYQKFKDFDHNRNFAVWIYRIAHNHLVDYYKKVKKQKVPIEDVENKLKSDDKLSQILNDKMNLDKVNDVLDTMPEKQRDIVVMRFINDLSNKETAEIMQITETHVRVLQNRALQFLRSRLSFLNS